MAETTRKSPRLGGDIAITGIGESEFTSGGGNDTVALIFDACKEAIRDAGLRPDEIDGVVTEGYMMPDAVQPTDLNEVLGTNCQFSANTSVTGAGTATAPLVAAHAINNGIADHVITYFGVDWASEFEVDKYEGGPYSYHTEDPIKRNFEVPFGWVTQPVYVAAMARRHMYEYGTTREQLGEVAIQTRENAIQNSKAIKTDQLTQEDYFDNPVIADPFRILDCCLISDGAGAFVMSSAESAESGPQNPVYVRGVGQELASKSASSCFTQKPSLTSLPVETAGDDAFDMAGVSREEIDFLELYDCFSIIPPIQLEDLGFCEKGEGGTFVSERGITVENGDLPVNTHGGLLSQAYLLGINHVTEAVKQIRGTADNQVEGAELGLVGLWSLQEYGALILGRSPQ